MKLYQRIVPLFILALVCLPVFSAGNQETTDAQKEKVVINYYTWENAEKNNPIFEEFMQDNPDIEVVVNFIPDNNDKMVKLDIMAMGGGEIDVMPLADGDQFARAENGILLNLDQFIERDGIDMRESFGGYEEWARYQDNYYCYPLRATLGGLYYNKDMFDAAGIPYPTPDWTFDEYLQIAKALAKDIDGQYVYGAYQHTWAQEWAVFGAQKASFYTEDGLSNIEDPTLVTALKNRKMMDDERIQKSFPLITSTKTIANIEFLGEKTAMAVAVSWLVRDMKDKNRFPFDFDAGIAYLPRFDETVAEKQIYMSVSGLGIPSTSQHPEEAWRFIRYYIENGSKYIAQAGNVPCYLPAYDGDLIENYISGSGLSVQDVSPFFDEEAQKYSLKLITGTAMTEYTQIINEEASLYLTGSKTLEDTISSIKTRADQAIQKQK
ncbi:MAG: ABC transporter substrate-binding protein [Sphaerochaetaceae bacterium]